MTGLPWIRFDTTLPDDPKVLLLVGMRDGLAAGFVYCCGLAYSGKHGTDGFIPSGALPRLNGRPAHAARLVEVGLWIAVPGGWLIHGWADRQESTDASRARREKAQKAAAARWSRPRSGDGTDTPP